MKNGERRVSRAEFDASTNAQTEELTIQLFNEGLSPQEIIQELRHCNIYVELLNRRIYGPRPGMDE